MTTTWWFAVDDEDSDLFGEEFFVEVDVPMDKAKREAMKIAKENFPKTRLTCYGRISNAEAEAMGLDTY
jgi:hypothetical protein